LGAGAAGSAGAVMGLGANAAARALAERGAAGRIARSLYRTPQQNAARTVFPQSTARGAGALARSVIPLQNQQQNDVAQRTRLLNAANAANVIARGATPAFGSLSPSNQ
jgi:hypothetical protein